MPNESVTARASRLYAAVGLLLPLTAAFTAVAALLQHFSRLPSDYTWGQTWRIAWAVSRREHFPTLVLIALAIGAMRRRTGWNLAVLRAPVDLARQRTRLIRATVGSFAMLVLGALVALRFDLIDHLSLMALGGIVGWRGASRTQLWLFAGHLGAVLLTFMLVGYTFTIFKAFLFVANAPRDAQILAVERGLFGGNPHLAVARWSARHPAWVAAGDEAYFRLFEHMTLVSVLLIGMRRARERTEYLAALVFCYLLGGLAYYACPGLGPVFFDPRPYAFLHDPTLHADSLRRGLLSNTAAAARGDASVLASFFYIACMPSLHMTHEFVMLYYARRSALAATLSVLFTALTLYAVMALGWHYALDVIAAVPLAAIAITLARWQRHRLLPAPLMRIEDEPLPVEAPARA